MRSKNLFQCKILLGCIYLTMICPLIGLSQEFPYMYVDNQESSLRKAYFDNNRIANGLSKGEVLDAIIQENYSDETHPRKYTFDINFFKDLLSQLKKDNQGATPLGVNIYLGAFDPNSIPDNTFSDWALQNQIVLIFSGPNSSNQNYYVYGPGNIIKPLPEKFEKIWVNNYTKNIIRHKDVNGNEAGLITTIFADDEEDHTDADIKNDASDTRSIFYKWEDFDEFINTERNRQNNLHGDQNYITGIDIYLSSFSLSGLERGNHVCELPRTFRNRLHLLFEFMHKNNDYPIPTQNRTPNHKWCTSLSQILEKKQKKDTKEFTLFSSDNGQLCPPKCNN